MTGDTRQARLGEMLAMAPVIPVLTVNDVDTVVPLVEALAAGGLPVVEITLRTAGSEAAIARAIAECPMAVVGAGTVNSPALLDRVVALGAAFAVSPGVSPRLLDAMSGCDVPCLPGMASASEAMSLAERGFLYQKFFPAEASGGIAALKAFAGPLPDLRICPTGGVDARRALDYLACPNVVCVGGSWVAPAAAVRAGDWAEVTRLAVAAAALSRSAPAPA